MFIGVKKDERGLPNYLKTLTQILVSICNCFSNNKITKILFSDHIPPLNNLVNMIS